MRKRYRVLSQKYNKATDKLVDSRVVGQDLTLNKANLLVRAYVKGFEALDDGYKDYTTSEDNRTFFFYSESFLKDFYFILTVEEEKNFLTKELE